MTAQPAATVFRDFVTDGVPLSGPWKPIKSEIREWGTDLETGRVKPVANRTALKAIDTNVVTSIYLLESGREGFFIWTLGDFSTQVAADTLEGLYVKATAVAATVGAWVRSYNGELKARWFGTTQAAIEAALGFGDDITLDQLVSITATSTWAAGKTIRYAKTGGLSIATGITLTHLAGAKASLRQIFTYVGTGNVVGLRSVRPEWFGAVRNGVTDDQPALQRAHDCAVGSPSSKVGLGWAEVILAQGDYAIKSKWTLTPTGSVPLRVRGAGASGQPANGGTQIKCVTTYTGTIAVHLQGQSTGSAERIANWDIRDFNIICGSATASIGFFVGADATLMTLVGSQQSIIENVYVDGFQSCWKFNQVRLSKITRCSGWTTVKPSAVGCEITLDNPSGNFTGDLDFSECQFVNERQGGSATLYIHFTGGGTIAGLDFYRCVFYHSDVSVAVNISGTNAELGDVWFTSCQFDGQLGDVFNITQATASSSIHSIFVEHCYMQGLNGTAVRVNNTAGAFQDFFFNNNWIRGATLGAGELFRFQGTMSGIQITGNIIAAAATTGNLCTFFDAATQLIVSDNIIRSHNGATAANFLVLSATSNYYVACNNNGKPAGAITGSMVVELNGTAIRTVSGNAQGQISGTNTNDAAAAGYVGEYLETIVASGSAVALTNATAANMATLALTPGDWDVDVVFNFSGTATTNLTSLLGCLSLTSATLDTTAGRIVGLPYPAATAFNSSSIVGIAVPPLRISVNANTTVYAVARANFTVSTCAVYGIIRARRVR